MGPSSDPRGQALDIGAIVSRLSTLFSTMQDFPVIRYKVPPAPQASDPPGAEERSTLTQRLGMSLLEKLVGMQGSGTLPAKETCDLIILDRWAYMASGSTLHLAHCVDNYSSCLGAMTPLPRSFMSSPTRPWSTIF